MTSIMEIILTFTYVNVSCAGGSDGIAFVSPSGGTPPFTYQWDTSAGLQTDSAATGLLAGIYALTVTDNRNCEKEFLSVAITEPLIITLTISFSNVVCKGGNNGNATVTASGGSPPYTFFWSTGDSENDVVQSSIDTLVAGTYSVI